MGEEPDFNDVLESIFLREEATHKESYEEGLKAGSSAGNPEGFHLGYHRGAELGREIGYYLGIVTHHLTLSSESADLYPKKLIDQLTKVKELIDAFPRENCEDQDILGKAETIRSQYKKACAMLKISSANPYEIFCMMESTLPMLRAQLDSITRYLTPLLPIANSHMVEFLTHNHWEALVPTALRQSLDCLDLDEALNRFWNAASDTKSCEPSELTAWISKARSHCLTPNGHYCLTSEQCLTRFTNWGGCIPPQIRIKEFMSPKKSYEVAVLSRMVASLSSACDAACCVEAGGGRGALAACLSLAHGLRALSVDCAPRSETAAAKRTKAMQKSWHSLAVTEQASNTNCSSNGHMEKSEPEVRGGHRFATAYVTSTTDMAALVKQHYPDLDDVKLILTGLHTCGNLGPDSLRIFVSQSPTVALLNVPCCYHLLTEALDDQLFDVFQRDYGGHGDTYMTQGFPMSEHLRGYNLGRNARMLAAQSMDRVVAKKQFPAKTLLYRALFQAIIKKHLPEFSAAEGKLKRLSHYEDFRQYFKSADSILKLDVFEGFSSSSMDEVCRDIDRLWKELVLFYMLRLCLAQVVESVILLDRLMFLYEQGFSKAFLVKLFDPVISPRCHSIVAVR